MTKSKEHSSSPDKQSSPDKHSVASRENSACSVDTLDGSPVKDGKRSRTKAGSLNKLFSLPESEDLVDDFICALRRKVLYQGRMYIFEHFLCFYSKLFNHQKIVTIPLKDVTQIRKKSHYGFSNSLVVVWKGKRDTFTSFLKRDNAFKILSYAWSKSSPYAKLFGGVEEEDTLLVPKVVHTDSKKILGSVRLAKLVHRPNGDTSKQVLLHEESSEEDDSMFHTGEAGGKGMLGSDIASHHDSDSDTESDVTETAEGTEEWNPVSTPPPPVDPQATLLVDDQFDLSVHEFYKEFLSDKSQFFTSWHETRGDTQVHLSHWHKHPAVGLVRELTFITPLKQKIGPSKCLCTQTQRVRLHPGDHLIFQTSQIMDIPYGDYFSVETRWDYTPLASGKRCKVQSRLSIPFSKKTMFKGTIESSTRALCKEANEDFVKAAKNWMEPPIPMPPAAPPSCFADDESSDTAALSKKPKRPTHFSRADSLKLRMSSDLLVPDTDLLSKAPTAYRSDFARVLQLKKLESTQARLSGQLSRSKTRSLRFEDDSQARASAARLGFLRRRSFYLCVFLVLLSVVAYMGFQDGTLGTLHLPRIPHLPWPSQFMHLPKPRWIVRATSGWRVAEEIEDLSESVAVLRTTIKHLEDQIKTLNQRIVACES